MTNEATEAVRLDAGAPVPEELPSLSDFYEEPGGGISTGWHRATITGGHSTQKGTQFQTGDEPANEGRRAFRLCFSIDDNGTAKTMQQTYFYDPALFTKEGLERIKALRKQYASQRVWPGLGREQNFSITLGHLSQLEKAVGFQLKRHPNGGFITVPYVGQKVDVRVGRDKKDYATITAFAPAGTKAR